MAQIRARIRARRGTDHADAEIRELAAERLAGLIGSHGAQAELLEKLRQGAAAAPEAAPIDDSSLYGQPGPLRWVRRLLSPILALFLSPKAMVRALGRQGDVLARQEQTGAVLFELVKNLVLEMTRLEVEVKELEMRVESQSTRFEFAERRARAVEGIARYRSEQAPEPDGARGRAVRESGPERPAREPVVTPQAGAGGQPQGGHDAESADAKRRRRRRRGRRGGAARLPGESGASAAEQAPGGDAHAEPDAAASGANPGESPAPEPRHEEPSTPPEHDG